MSTTPQTIEAVAYALFEEIAYVENKRIRGNGNDQMPDRAWILSTYAECLATVRGKTASGSAGYVIDLSDQQDPVS